MDEKTIELIAIGASISSHCLPCLDHHLKKAKELGVNPDDIRKAVEIGHLVEKGSMSAMKKYSANALEILVEGDPYKL